MNAKTIPALAGLLGLAACGRVAELHPTPGHALPVKPLMAPATPTVAELLTPPTNARPRRVDELITRSQPRAADPFDLPPPTGGPAPVLPAGADPRATPDNPSSTNPGD